MTDNENRLWFPAKRYGWGWGFPDTWQGRMTLAIYFLFLLAGIYIFETTTLVPELAFILYVIGISPATQAMTTPAYLSQAR